MNGRNIFHVIDDDDRGPSAEDLLSRALLDLAARNRRTPCADPDTWQHWTSENHHERDAVAERCHACPVIDQCQAAAEEKRPTHGVWAGFDYSRRRATR